MIEKCTITFKLTDPLGQDAPERFIREVTKLYKNPIGAVAISWHIRGSLHLGPRFLGLRAGNAGAQGTSGTLPRRATPVEIRRKAENIP
jgi:hypothetical protein